MKLIDKKLCVCLMLITVLLSYYGCSSSENLKTGHLSNQETFYIKTQQDFNRYKNYHFPAGAKVLFAEGAIFNGQFAPAGSGKKGNPIIIAAYNPQTSAVDTTNIDDKPLINGHGKVSSVLLLHNSQYFEINNLEVTNTNGSNEDQGNLTGIHVIANDRGIMHDIIVKNCYIHDVNGKVAGKHRGGIQINVEGQTKPTRFDHIRILNNVIQKVGGIGIGNSSSWGGIRDKSYDPWTDFIVRGNRVEQTGRNAMIIRYSKHPIIEYNVVAHSTLYGTGNSIFNFNTVDCVMQYNEVYGNTGPAVEHDHGAFDADYNAKGTVIQYNYSHGNNWFASIMRKYNKGVTIRYNISQNELQGCYFYGFFKAEGVKNVKIYNNTHYFKTGLHATLFVQADRARVPIQTTMSNEIFYFSDQARWGHAPGRSCTLTHNLFYHIIPKGTHNVTADPKFKNPGQGGTNIDMKTPGRLAGYQLQASSPAINTGTKISDNGGQDFWGHLLYHESPDIGAEEYQQ